MVGKGDAHIGKSNDKLDERLKSEETKASEALLKDLTHGKAGTANDAQKAAADQMVKNFVHGDAQHHDTKTVAADLTRLANKFDQLFKPGENGQGSLFDRMTAHDPTLAKSLQEGMQTTFDLAKKVAESYESGKIQPGQDTPQAVEKLMERLSHQK